MKKFRDIQVTRECLDVIRLVAKSPLSNYEGLGCLMHTRSLIEERGGKKFLYNELTIQENLFSPSSSFTCLCHKREASEQSESLFEKTSEVAGHLISCPASSRLLYSEVSPFQAGRLKNPDLKNSR